MTIHETSCVYQGRTYFGVFEVSGHSPDATVSVRYNGDELEGPVGGLPAPAVASRLLGELIVRRTIAETVTVGSRQDPDAPRSESPRAH